MSKKKRHEKKIIIQYSSTGEMKAKEAVRRIIEAHSDQTYQGFACTR